MSDLHAFIAENRFGYGTDFSGRDTIATDPMGWLLAQLHPRYAANPALSGLPSTTAALKEVKDMMAPAKILKKSGDAEAAKTISKESRREIRDDYIRDAAARTRAAVEGPAPFFERLVHFWSNHFTVSILKRQSLPLAGAFERDAIRPHILGRFETLLTASTQHPAMLLYLDNARSIGPNSLAGKKRGKGLNENLAREVLELHTVGVSGGYAQNDVISLAKILTGWSVGDGFRFARMLHEPGIKTLLGKSISGDGLDEGTAALRHLARLPATAQHIATKLARHFITDDPPASAITALADSFHRNDGDLMAVYKTLIALDAAWQNPLSKIKTPNDYIISLLRASHVDSDDLQTALSFRTLGQTPYAAPSPAGWSDRAKDWISAEALLQRIAIARQIADKTKGGISPKDMMEQTIGPVASAETKFAVTSAGSRAEAIALLFASPEFQRR